MAMMYGGMLYFPLKVNLFEEIAVNWWKPGSD